MTAFYCHRLQEVVFAQLMADEELSARLSGLYDEVPLGASMPYLAMGETNISPAGLKDRQGNVVTFALWVWSDGDGQLECKDLLAAVDRLLSRHKPTVPGCHAGEIILTGAAVTRQYAENGSRYRGRLAYKVQLYEEDAA
ncbi:DUF3168 domain-containing protein [Kordiimonas aestuarii]|uniref:DUF3168 domain-containing protein n=1 Tax=Kordiimonas aestuarii TaxID=1005925 RepID=UPI0021D33813|nr:DUF3168 domain-containing protein [Kordiimonas aestuarii]